ncbi:unnamed protein product [Agarophyton chilense]
MRSYFLVLGTKTKGLPTRSLSCGHAGDTSQRHRVKNERLAGKRPSHSHFVAKVFQSSRKMSPQPTPQAAVPPTRPSTNLSAIPPRYHSQVTIIVGLISDLKKAIDDFLAKIENALHVPYDAARARKDFETISSMLVNLEKVMEERDILHMRDRDYIGPGKPNGSTIDELVDKAMTQKTTVDAEFHKLTSAAAAAANAAVGARWGV